MMHAYTTMNSNDFAINNGVHALGGMVDTM